ncbi:hypothetical protein PSN45_004966 [Yamadazyma tenuis]|uniref:Prokaryotic-type class I peptide chain release factors domain-containing protein n=1 Tax=Candida tenuis (strain ATCC 10573 / BCRC 21748 / CBS 615 / JCM 9827 / NBRC 10315 / NRRL Y-1498 / VKM Y-70) TaxID=590646 RepID=G3B2A9_CANTC|nr:uncharacterized protein CANTEDRAFT_120400 [Yamadazyma tenuis ATCC 10573]EGV64633.1 hypothetical protein CANTEDRAFT_120400 [Yamadazyma tenuis ATCC 10573]WEJ97415.1 hypothetical protein PSN45_004966 [Yamadazyma tenuis]
MMGIRTSGLCRYLLRPQVPCREYVIPKKTKLPPRPKWLIKEEDIEESFIKGGSGPGGQKINKTNSKVQLKHIPTGIVVTSQHSRSQEQNRQKAREILAEKLDLMENGPKSRVAVVTERKVKLKQSKQKKSHRKYRKIEEGRAKEKEFEELVNIEDEIDQMTGRG